MSDSEDFQNNPFAICTAEIDRKKEPAKWERCVQKVKKEMGLSEAQECFRGDIPGGGYVAECISDEEGEYWTIRDVPFFSEMPAGVRNNENSIGKDWMEATIKRHQQLERDQKHLPPVHANHHDTGRENFRIGFLRPTKVAQLAIDGKDRWTLFGDIIHVEPHHYDQIKDLGYPYRSAEIGRGWSPEIASLALSEDEAPHFKLPMLTIGEERNVPFDQMFVAENRPAIAFSARKDSSVICFSFTDGITMSKPKVEKLQEGKEKDPDEEKMQEDDGVAKDIAKVFADFQKRFPDIIKSFLDDMVPPTVRTNEGELPVEPSMLKAILDKFASAYKKPDKETTDMKEQVKEEKDTERMAELMAKVASLEDKESKREADQKVDILADDRISALLSEGWNLSENTEKAIRDIAGESEKALEKFVEEYKRNTPKDPPKSFEEIHVFKEEAPELQKYRTQSPEVLAAALALSGQFDDLKEQGCTLSSSREEFIDINLEAVEHV